MSKKVLYNKEDIKKKGPCGRIRQKSCSSKKRFRDPKEAKTILKKWSGQRIYYCSFCNGWHLTKKPSEISGQSL